MSLVLWLALPPVALVIWMFSKISGDISQEERVEEDRRAWLSAQEGRNP